MQPSFLIALNVLVLAETVLTVSALAACLRAGTKNPVREMRDYLIVRAANAIATAIVLFWPGQALLRSVQTTLSTLIYYFWFWSAALILLFLEMRVAVGATAEFFRGLPGVQGLARIATRWVAIAGMIVMIPLLLEITVNFNNRAYLRLIRSWWCVFSVLQLAPVVLALLVGAIRKVRWNSRPFAILIGFAFEPFVQLAGPWSWTSKTSMLQMENIAHELACCAAVALWTISYALPENPTALARSTAAMLRLDELARMTLRRSRPSAEESAQRGAQPWPKYRRDAWPEK
ncbi:MAG TPA: hypothetical protein VME68_04440 [Acidobacteriaceae bacterium]|nr:hypothetical protein [Acidobacteriaceae bacterium]